MGEWERDGVGCALLETSEGVGMYRVLIACVDNKSVESSCLRFNDSVVVTWLRNKAAGCSGPLGASRRKFCDLAMRYL